MESPLGKITALITRDTDLGRELLVFEHPTAGIQLPAGTIEPGETPETAVRRETADETGLTAVEIVAHLATLKHSLAPDERLILKRCLLQSSPGDYGTLYQKTILQRGQTVRVIGCSGDYDQVTYQEYALERGELTVVSSKTGWLPRQALTANVRYYLYHLRTHEPTPTQWQIDTDGQTLRWFWVPLTDEIGLISSQRDWLERVRNRL